MRKQVQNDRRNVAISVAIYNRLKAICYERNWSHARLVEDSLLDALLDLENEQHAWQLEKESQQ